MCCRGSWAMETKLESLEIRKKAFFTMARDAKEYQRSAVPTEEFVESLRKRNVDIFTFIERKWCCSIESPSELWARAEDNIALLNVTSYDEWLKLVGKKTRNMIRKAQKNNITTKVVESSKELAVGIWKIYNETPIRQQRLFPHFGASLESVRDGVSSAGDNVSYVGAFVKARLVWFIQLIFGDNIVVVSQILSLQEYWDKAINNAMLARVVEVCVSRNEGWLMYGRMGNHLSLDVFKQNNGFEKFVVTRYYIPLTVKGNVAVNLGLHKDVKDVLPLWLKRSLFPLYNWVSRIRIGLHG